MLRTIQFTMASLVLAVFLMCGALPAQAACTGQLIIFHAGSLNNAFKDLETQFTADTGICVTDKAFGSLDMLRQATAGGQAADIVAPADYLDIDLFLRPAGYADYNILFAEGKMVLAYLSTDPVVAKYTITDGTPFNPPTSVPNAVATWYNVLLNSDVTIGGSHLYLDPSGYRAPMIFRLAQSNYNVPNLYNNLLEHYVATPAAGAPSGTFALGKNYNFQLTYVRNAQAAALGDPGYTTATPGYQYVNLPDAVNLGNSSKNCYYRQAVIAEPDLFGTGLVPLPASRVVWGVSVMKKAPNKDNAILFLQKYLLSSIGKTALTNHGPDPISPAVVSSEDYRKIPQSLRPLVQVDHLLGCPEEWRCR
ncbi:MAG TPA: substrate-binding domain-containing protein [Syntrophorhabdales bacterium]|nr:substrate-binding domain-containing protein [Syntrophorhabdales bacterium]